jgi:hypothetical protein
MDYRYKSKENNIIDKWFKWRQSIFL